MRKKLVFLITLLCLFCSLSITSFAEGDKPLDYKPVKFEWHIPNSLNGGTLKIMLRDIDNGSVADVTTKEYSKSTFYTAYLLEGTYEITSVTINGGQLINYDCYVYDKKNQFTVGPNGNDNVPFMVAAASKPTASIKRDYRVNIYSNAEIDEIQLLLEDIELNAVYGDTKTPIKRAARYTVRTNGQTINLDEGKWKVTAINVYSKGGYPLSVYYPKSFIVDRTRSLDLVVVDDYQKLTEEQSKILRERKSDFDEKYRYDMRERASFGEDMLFFLAKKADAAEYKEALQQANNGYDMNIAAYKDSKDMPSWDKSEMPDKPGEATKDITQNKPEESKGNTFVYVLATIVIILGIATFIAKKKNNK